MQIISHEVQKIIEFSPIPLVALQNGYLNLSAYANTIHRLVEKKTKKPVKKGSIVAALARFEKVQQKTKPLMPKINVQGISAKSELVEVTFEKTAATMNALSKMYNDRSFVFSDFFTVTNGIREITIITSRKTMPAVRKKFAPTKPHHVMENLASLTVRLGEHYLETPNVIYALVQEFGLRRINIVEIISTLTEMSFVLKQTDLERSFLVLNALFVDHKK